MEAYKFKLTYNSLVYIPQSIEILSLNVSWVTGIELDFSLICLDVDGNYFDQSSFMQLITRDNSVIHKGDLHDLDGNGNDQFDEVITINFSKLDKQVYSIWPIVTVYTQKRYFNSVTNFQMQI